MSKKFSSLCICLCALAAAAGTLTAAEPIVFADVTSSVGLGKYLNGPKPWRIGHGAAWGDVNGDGRPDLYVGAFAEGGRERDAIFRVPGAPPPNMLFLNTASGFKLSDEQSIRLLGKRARTSCALFADLDNDGDLDLIVSSHVSRGGQGSMLFENTGGGRFRDVTPGGPPWPHRLGARNVTAFDINGDGLLDLIFANGGYRRGGHQTVVLANKGKFTFASVAAAHGLDLPNTKGLGLAVGDVNDDGLFDIFVAGSNRLFVSGAGRKYHEVQPGTFIKPPERGEPETCGADFGDLNGDGLLDLVTTVHGQPSRIRVYLNKGIRNGDPHYVQITQAAGVARDFPSWGITKLRVKNAHVDLQDMDNDGRTDIVLCVTYKDSRGQVQPVVLRNLGNRGGVPRFTPPPYARMVAYYAPAPLCDYDSDGRLDIFMAPWPVETPAYLFHNVTKAGHWLTVRVVGAGPGLNTMGVGSVVRVYHAGRAGDSKGLIARRDIAIGTGYSSGEQALAHVGLGDAATCDVEVTWGALRERKTNVAADQALTVTVEAK